MQTPRDHLSAALAGLESQTAERLRAIAEPGPVSRFVDKVVGAISPRALAGRMESRTQAAMAVFQAAEVSRLTMNWDAPETSGDGAMIQDGALMNARMRGAKRDNWAIASMTDSYRRDVGCMTPRAAAFDLRTREKLEDFNRRIDFAWRRWAMTPGFCDFHKQQSLTDLMGLTVEEAIQTGQGFVMPAVKERGGPVPLVLQLFEFEQLATELIKDPNGNEIKSGIEVDKDGVAVAYHFYMGGHPLEWEQGEVTRIPADRILRLAQFDRVRSVLASSVLTPSLTAARSLATYLNYEDRAKHIEACVSLQLRKDQGYANKAGSGIGMGASATKAPASQDLVDANGRKVKRMESGVIYDPPPGSFLESVGTNRPGGAFESYINARAQHVAAGGNRSKSAVTREFTASYTAERRGEVEDHKGNRLWHERQVTQVLQPIRNLFIDLMIMTGKVQVPAEFLRDPELRAGLYETEWMPPRREPIDPSRAAAAQKIRLDYKLTNRGRELNEEGRDWHDNFDDISEQKRYAEELGIPLPEMQAGGAGATSPNEARPSGTSDAPDGTGDDDDNSDNNGGDEETGDDENAGRGAKPRAAFVGGMQ